MMRVRIKIGNAAVPWRWNMDEGVPFFTSLLWLTSRLADVAAFPGLECQFLGQFIYIPVPKCYGMSTTKAFSFLLYFSSHSLTSSKLGTIYILFKKFSKFFFPCRNNVRLAYPIFFFQFLLMWVGTGVLCMLGTEYMAWNRVSVDEWVWYEGTGGKGPAVQSYGFWTMYW